MFLRSAQKHEAHESNKQSDQTMAQPEVAPNVTTGITKVMLIRKSGGATGGASSENTEGASPI